MSTSTSATNTRDNEMSNDSINTNIDAKAVLAELDRMPGAIDAMTIPTPDPFDGIPADPYNRMGDEPVIPPAPPYPLPEPVGVTSATGTGDRKTHARRVKDARPVCGSRGDMLGIAFAPDGETPTCRTCQRLAPDPRDAEIERLNRLVDAVFDIGNECACLARFRCRGRGDACPCEYEPECPVARWCKIIIPAVKGG